MSGIFFFYFCVWRGLKLCILLFSSTLESYSLFFSSLEAAGCPSRNAEALWAPGHATGWGYGSVQQGKSLPERLHPRVQPGSLRNHSPESHQRALLGKSGRDWALKCCSALSYLRECVEALAGSQKDSALLSRFGFSRLARKQRLNSVLL